MVSSLVSTGALVCCIVSCVSSAALLSSVSQSNQITNEFDGDGDSYWVSTSRFDPMKNAVYGSITLKKSFYMKFDLTWHGLTREAANRDYEGIMRIGNPSSVVKDCSGHATRYPALYLDRDRKSIQFSLSNDIDCWGVGLLNVSLTDLQIDSVYTLIIQYNQSWVYIQANDDILYNQARIGSTPDDMLYSTASIMLSDGLDPPADVTLSDMLILSYDDELTMYPTPVPSAAPSKQPTKSPTPSPTKKPTPAPTTTTLHPTPHPTEPADFFATNIKIYAEYQVDAVDQSKMALVDEKDIEAMVLDIFPPWNITMNAVNIDNYHDSINLNMIVSVNTNDELVILQSFLDEEMSLRLENEIEHHYEWMNITDVHYNHIINPMYLSQSNNLNDGNSLIPWLPFEDHTAIWMILGAIGVCACSTILFTCTLWYICKLRRRNKVRSQFRRTGIIVDGQSAKQMSQSSNSANSNRTNSKSGDGYANDPDTTFNRYRPQREEVELMQTDGSYVRRKKNQKNKRPQYERIHSTRDDDLLHDDDDEHDSDDQIAAQFMTPWGPMTGGFDLGIGDGDGHQETGGAQQHGGCGWEFEYDFNIDTFPFHLLPTLTQMYEDEAADGNVTGGSTPQKPKKSKRRKDRGHGHHRQQSSTLDVVMEDQVESIRLQGHRDMGKKKRKRRNTTKDSFECGVEDSICESTEESNLATKSRSSSMYDEGFGRRDTMPDTIPDPTSPERRSTITVDTTEANYMGGSEQSRLSSTE